MAILAADPSSPCHNISRRIGDTIGLAKRFTFSAYHLSRNTFRHYVDQLQRSRPTWLHGYPSFLALLAGFMHDAGLQLDYQPKWITTGAENLLPHQIALIQAAFGRRPLQHYGTREAVANISEHPDGSMYVDEDFSAVEFVPSNVAGAYRIVGTNLANLAMPMIRYEVGDIVQLPDESDQSRVRRVIGIDGRKEDYIVLKNGSQLGRLDHIFKDMVAVREAQIYQETPGEVEIRVVKSVSFCEQMNRRCSTKLKSEWGRTRRSRLPTLMNCLARRRENCDS